MSFLKRFALWFSKLGLTPKIYFSLTAIIFPVFLIIIFIQIRVTQPMLEDEVRQIGLSVCRSLSSDILAQSLLTNPEKLESRIIEITWQQPTVYQLSVFTLENEKLNVVASNIEDDQLPDISTVKKIEFPETQIQKESGRDYWQILFPVRNKSGNRINAYIRAEISLQVVSRVTSSFFKITIIGAIVAMMLLVWSLSSYLKHMIENEKKLQLVESEKTDLTAQLQLAQEQLFLNEKLAIMGQLTASFAHEIGTPLNSLSGHLQLLREEVREAKEQSRIDIINSQVSRIEGIVKNFLASTHSPTQQKQLIDLKQLIEQMINLVRPRLESQKISTHITQDGNIRFIQIVPSDFEQVLINLINNAIDAINESKKQIRTLDFHLQNSVDKHGRSGVDVLITDSGEGMDPKAKLNIFKPFFTTKAPGKGTGLGLNISQGLVKKYGGRLEIDSVLGKGTTVKVSFLYDAP